VSLRDLIRRGGRLLKERRHATKRQIVTFFLPLNGRDVEGSEHEISGWNGPEVTLFEPGGPDDPTRLPSPDESDDAAAPDGGGTHGGTEP
jgi:hypothetical protein